MKSLVLIFLLASSAEASSLQQLDLFSSSAAYRISGTIGVAASTGAPTDYQFIIDGPGGYLQFPDGSQQTTAGGGGGTGSTVTANSSQFSGTGAASSPLTLKSSSVTLQGNTFNGASQLVQLNGSGFAPISITGTANDALAVAQSGVNLSTVTARFLRDEATVSTAAYLGLDNNFTGNNTISSLTVTNTLIAGMFDISTVTADVATIGGPLTVNASSITISSDLLDYNLIVTGGTKRSVKLDDRNASASTHNLAEIDFMQIGTIKHQISAYGDTNATYPQELQLGSPSGTSSKVRITGSSTLNPDVFVSSFGSVGINTATPNTSYKLDVNGAIGSTSLVMGGRTQTIGYSPVVVSSVATNTLAIVLGASKVCVSTQAATTFLGGRFQHILGHANVTVSAGGSVSLSQTIEMNGSVIDTDMISRPASVDDLINLYFPIASSTAGSNVFRVCYVATGSGVATVTDYQWAIIEW